jgi:AraC family transcriptional regulator of adaptative response/methylated-DNA-[protein]-cysteine methyltransferase
MIAYSIFNTQFGICLVASTEKGICNILFADTKPELVLDLKSRWKTHELIEKTDPRHIKIKNYFKNPSKNLNLLFDMKGTLFQKKVWKELQKIPAGKISSYGKIAEKLGDKKLSRVVGTAIGNNPIGYIIPCHRVLTSTGGIGGFRWGIERKKKMLLSEAVKVG